MVHAANTLDYNSSDVLWLKKKTKRSTCKIEKSEVKAKNEK